MHRVKSAAILPICLCAAALGPFPYPAGAQTPAPTYTSALSAPDLDALRSATQRYQNVLNALADGYVADPANLCITASMEGSPSQLGAMGIHYFRPDLLGITSDKPRVDGNGTHTDFLRPGVLIYEPQADGSLELVAIENLVFAKAWKEVGKQAPPTYAGNEYYYMIDNPLTPVDEAHHFEPHYELHLWLYRDNPSGMFSPFNPRATCEHHRGGMDHSPR